STVVLDNTTAGEYTKLNDYNFLRSNRSIFPTFANELILTPTFVAAGGHGNFFGTAVTISGNGSILAVGSSNVINFARVDVYQRSGNTWVSRQVILPPSVYSFAGFGAVASFGTVLSLSYDGSILAVGMPSALIGNASPPPYPTIFMYEYEVTTNQYQLIQSIRNSTVSGFASSLQLSATGQYLVVTDD